MIRTLVYSAGIVALFLGNAHAQTIAAAPHNIIGEDLSEHRRVVALRLDRRQDETELLRIASLIQSRAQRTYARTQVNFFLPGMAANQNAWASVMFTPEPKVSVFGLSRADEDLFLAERQADQRPLLGSWLTSPPAASGRLTIYSDHGKIYAEWRLRSGQKTVDEVQDSITKAGRRFDVTGAGYYVLTRSGELEIWEKTTLIATAERIRPEHLALPSTVALGPKGHVPVVAAQHAPIDQRPSSPVQPEPKIAAGVPSASSSSSTPALPLPAAGLTTHEPPAQPSLAAAEARKPAAEAPNAKSKRAAKMRTKTRVVQSTKVTAQANSASKSNTLSPGDAISAKMAGRL